MLVGVSVGVGVGDGVAVLVDVGVAVGVRVAVGVDVRVAVGNGVGARVDVADAASAAVAVGSTAAGVAIGAGPHAASKILRHTMPLFLESKGFKFFRSHSGGHISPRFSSCQYCPTNRSHALLRQLQEAAEDDEKWS